MEVDTGEPRYAGKKPWVNFTKIAKQRFVRQPGRHKAPRRDHHNVPDRSEHPEDRAYRKGIRVKEQENRIRLIQQIRDGLSEYLADRQNGQKNILIDLAPDIRRRPRHYETESEGFNSNSQPSNSMIHSTGLTRREKRIVNSSHAESNFGRRR